MSGQTQKKEVIEATSESHMTRHGDEQTTNYWIMENRIQFIKNPNILHNIVQTHNIQHQK